MRTHFIAGFLFVCLAVSTSWAQPLGTAFTYQGRLKNGGSPANGSFNMDFKLYPVPTGSTQLASQTLPGVSVSDGLFTVQVDFGPGMFDGSQRWLEVSVNGTPLVPRQSLTAAPNALFASNADRLDGLDSTAFLTGIPNPLSLTGTNDFHIIAGNNLSTVNGASGVYGLASAASAQIYGVHGESASTNGFAVFGVATSTTGPSRGGFFECASSQGIGVLGLAKATSGAANGVYGQSDSSSGSGVYALATAATGTTYGVWGQSNSPSGRGIYGYAGAATGTTFGGSFETSSSGTDAAGIFGLASALSGTTYGVWGQSNSTSGYGVIGINDRTSGSTYGVYGRSSSPSGRGVFGWASATSGTTYGVYGQQCCVNGFGVYANGNLGAFGVKSFRIDHPNDPANKYLLHYAAESPEVINFYRGSVLLDAAGQAVVELPHYFAKINTAPSYQLTAIGAPMPMLHVADVIDEAALSAGAKAEPGEAAPKCSFRIAGGAPGAKVSWRVEAVRNDRWVRQGGAPVEVEKEGLEKGTYQHPELYGQPPEKGMNFDAMRERTDPARPVQPTPARPLSSAAAEAMPR